jgi:hypothetical protein
VWSLPFKFQQARVNQGRLGFTLSPPGESQVTEWRFVAICTGMLTTLNRIETTARNYGHSAWLRPSTQQGGRSNRSVQAGKGLAWVSPGFEAFSQGFYHAAIGLAFGFGALPECGLQNPPSKSICSRVAAITDRQTERLHPQRPPRPIGQRCTSFIT